MRSPMQANHVVAHGGEHAFHLMVAAFADGEAHFGRSDNFQQRRFGEIFSLCSWTPLANSSAVPSASGLSSATR